MTANKPPFTTLPRAAAILGLLFGSAWLLPLYEEGMMSVLSRMSDTPITASNRDLFAVAAFAVWVPIALAWRHSRLVGIIVQLGVLIAVVLWSLRAEPAVLHRWSSYAGRLLLACIALWLITLAAGAAFGLVHRRNES